MKRAVLFCNGEISDLSYHKTLLKETDLIIAVDGGGNFCREMDVVPEMLIGDFDSLNAQTKDYFEMRSVEIIPFPADKDYIDMVLGIEEAIRRNCDEILILGAFGGKRADMFFGNLMALSLFDLPIIMKNEWSEARFLKAGKNLDLEGKIGDYVSLIPLSDHMITGKSTGLKYQLGSLQFHRGETRSISNELMTEKASLSLKEGEAIVFLQKR